MRLISAESAQKILEVESIAAFAGAGWGAQTPWSIRQFGMTSVTLYAGPTCMFNPWVVFKSLKIEDAQVLVSFGFLYLRKRLSWMSWILANPQIVETSVNWSLEMPWANQHHNQHPEAQKMELIPSPQYSYYHQKWTPKWIGPILNPGFWAGYLPARARKQHELAFWSSVMPAIKMIRRLPYPTPAWRGCSKVVPQPNTIFFDTHCNLVYVYIYIMYVDSPFVNFCHWFSYSMKIIEHRHLIWLS